MKTCEIKGCVWPIYTGGLCVHHHKDRCSRFSNEPISAVVASERKKEMPTKCEIPGCTYLAVSGDTKCLQHKQRAVPKSPNMEAEGFSFVPMSEVPTNARYNEAAGKLMAAVKASQEGHALKVSMKVFKKVTLLTAQRYALGGHLRIGVRIVGETGYLWKLSESEIKSVEIKAQRMIAARSKRKTARAGK